MPVYLMVGLLIPLMPISHNYLLEITPMKRHASCIGIANGLMIASAFTPLLIGFLISLFGHTRVFLGLSILMLGGIYFSFRLGEPRFKAEPADQLPPLP